MPETPANADFRGMPDRLEVAVLFHRLGPYHHARLRAAGALMKVTGVEYSNVDKMYDWALLDGANGFSRIQLFSGEAVADLSAERILKRVGEVLDQVRPHVVAIPGWSDRCSLAALRWCNVRGIPAVVMSETTSWDFDRNWLKEAIKRHLLKLYASGLAGGRAHADYLEKLGFAPAKVFLGYDAVDNDYFSIQADKIRDEAAVIRSRQELPENYFLASARFVPKKNLARLIEAYAGYCEVTKTSAGAGCPGEPWSLVLLGDGPLREAIGQQIAALGLTRQVILRGFKQYEELPAYYALAKVFVHVSTTEQWGLVVNEAMASGLPVLVSSRCGCAMDLVEEGVNGFCFDPLNVKQLAELMMRCANPATDLRGLAQASRKKVAEWGVERFAAGLKQAAEIALQTPRARNSILSWLKIKLLMLQKERVST